MHHRWLVPIVVLLGLTAAPAHAAERSWAAPQERAAVRADLMASLAPGRFGGERPLTGPQMRDAMAALATRTQTPPVTVRSARAPSVFAFDRILVKQLGLGDVAEAVDAEATRAGLRPPPSFGTEVVARLAGLRHNHPSRMDGLELYPWQPITRSEAAWSLAQVAGWDGSEQQWVRDALAGFELPEYDATQLRILRRAVAKIGMPYIWGGETDTASAALGGQTHGGYDCSGFVWRVFKLSGDPLGPRIRGRVAADQANIPMPARRRLAQVEPGDLLFFGPGGFDARPTNPNITHEGIALSDAFMINSAASYGGVSVAPLVADDRRKRHFSWARNVF